jgi:hypothetical protein
MRFRKRAAVVLASAAALGVGLIAFPGSAAAAPPAVPTCAFPSTPGSDSCAKLVTTGSPNPIGAAYENLRLGVRVRSQFSPTTSETTSVTLRFDDDIKLNMGAVPGTCTAAQLTGKTIAQAYAQCGPGPGGSNTYLSPAGNVSGVGSTVIEGLDACTMIFQGANDNQLLIYARAPIGNPSSECNNPATNSGGSATVIFTGTLSHQPAASPYDWTLTVANTHTSNPSLDDFGATLFRGNALQARCPAGQAPHKLQGVWDYTAAGDANDTHNATDPC